MSDQSQIVHTLKAKAMLLIQREREVYALRLGRERMIAWLRAFERLSIEASPEGGEPICAAWTAAMIQELYFQTAAAYAFERGGGELTLLSGRSHAALPPLVKLDERGQRVVNERPQGVFDDASDPDLSALASSLGLQRFLWFGFPHGRAKHILLVAGVASGMAGGQAAIPSDDLINFTMLGRHLSVLLSNAALIGELGSAQRDLQELFDHMRQAIVAIDRTGTVGSISSRQAKVLFERDSLQGCSARDLLFPTAPAYDLDAASFTEWLELAFNTAPADWASCEPYAPREVAIADKNGREVPLELEFRPLVRDGAITQLMLLATDVSRERNLQQAVKTQEAQHARRIAAMRRLIAGGTEVLLAFVESTRKRLDRCDEVLASNTSELPTEAIDELFRQAHTIRGEARSFDLVELEDATTRMEEDLNELRGLARGAGHVLTASCLGRLRTGLLRTRQALERGCDMLVAASPSGALVFDQVTVCRSVLRELSAAAASGSSQVAALVARLAAVPLGVTAAGALESAAGWAALEGVVVAVTVEPRELPVPEGLAQVLPGVLTHLVRNAIAHGIEPASERASLGKPEQGSIRVHGVALNRGVRIVVEDDGRGLDVARLRARGGAATMSPEAATELVFQPGVSTRDIADQLAGQGVGLDAVRRDLARIGYDASLRFVPHQWTRVTIAPKE